MNIITLKQTGGYSLMEFDNPGWEYRFYVSRGEDETSDLFTASEAGRLLAMTDREFAQECHSLLMTEEVQITVKFTLSTLATKTKEEVQDIFMHVIQSGADDHSTFEIITADILDFKSEADIYNGKV